MKPIALLDCDGLMADFITPSLRVIAEITGVQHAHDDVTEWDFDKAFIPDAEGRARYWEAVTAEGFCASLKPYPAAIEGVALLREYADVYCVTSPMVTSKTWQHERLVWLKEHFGFSHKHVISTAAKHLVRGDVFVDDKPEHVRAWQGANADWGRGGLLWSRRYNESATDLERTDSWGRVAWRASQLVIAEGA